MSERAESTIDLSFIYVSDGGMHPTRDTIALIYFQVAGGRVMPSVRCPVRAAAKR